MEHRALIALAIVLAGFSGTNVFAQDVALTGVQEPPAESTPLSVVERWRADPAIIFDASEINLTELVFIARPVVVFADNANDPQFGRQIDLLEADLSGLALRDVIIIVDTDPAARSDVRQTLRPRGIGLVLIDKDGRVAQRKPAPWDVRELTRAIDKMTTRIQEIRDRESLAQ